jgi:hypothetical protein
LTEKNCIEFVMELEEALEFDAAHQSPRLSDLHNLINFGFCLCCVHELQQSMLEVAFELSEQGLSHCFVAQQDSHLH